MSTRPSLPPWTARLDDPVEQDHRRAELEDALDAREWLSEREDRMLDKAPAHIQEMHGRVG